MVKCVICGMEFQALTWKHLFYKHSITIEEYDKLYGKVPHGISERTPEQIAKMIQTRKIRGIKAWNKGLTKNDHPSLMKISIDRTGDNNPVFKIKDREAWIKNVIEGRKEYDESRRGKTLEEFYGEEKALIIKQNQSEAAKVREVHGHTGFYHTEETKQILREKTTNRIANLKDKISIPHQKLFDKLKEIIPENFDMRIEYNFGFYCLDIAILSFLICIEVDGDFWHVNEKEGFELKYDCQKRNKINEKSKTTFLLNRNWKIIRVWESEINADIDKVVEKILKFVEENKTNGKYAI